MNSKSYVCFRYKKTAIARSLISLMRLGIGCLFSKENKPVLDKTVEKWISFQLPLNRDYSDLKYIITLDDGQCINRCNK